SNHDRDPDRWSTAIMPSRTNLGPVTRRLVATVYGSLDYDGLGPVYCYEGGNEFWRAQRGPCDRRSAEVAALNHACHSIPLTFQLANAASARGRFDHLWIVSVLDDPERF